MGWCQHPKRRLGSDAKIFVRAQELPCRNQWNTDLWQSMPQVASDIVVESGMRPLDPALADELALGPNPASSGRDVVLGGINGFVNDQSGEQTSRPRGAWRRAHEQV